MSYSARPPRVDPVKATAVMRGSRTASTPVCSPSISANTPGGAPAASSAALTTAAVRRDSWGCPGWALTTTGHPAAIALTVSPPATLNANGKLPAA